jgi:ribosomal protein S18 acetylase RimI-like enzyme
LHVRSANTRAISVYERLGFRKRTEFQLAVVAKPA